MNGTDIIARGLAKRALDSVSAFDVNQKIYYASPTGLSTNSGNTPNTAVDFATALTKAGNTANQVCVLPGTYTGDFTITQLNVTITSANNEKGGLCNFTGTITVSNASSSVRMFGITVANVVHNGAGGLYLSSCKVNTSFSSTSSGYLEIDNTDTQGLTGTGTISITGTGLKNFVGQNKLGFLAVSNAAVTVAVANNITAAPMTITAGTLAIANTPIYSATGTSNAVTATAPGGLGTTVVIFDGLTALTPTNTQARISLGSNVLYGFRRAIFDRVNSTITGVNAPQEFISDTIYGRNGGTFAGLLNSNGRASAMRTVTGNTTLTATDEIVFANATTGAIVVTLPAATNLNKFKVVKIDSSANTVTITRAWSDTINGATTKVLSNQFDGAELSSNGATAWYAANSGSAIANNSVTNALLAQAPANTLKGNNTGGTANVQDLTTTQVASILPVVRYDTAQTLTQAQQVQASNNEGSLSRAYTAAQILALSPSPANQAFVASDTGKTLRSTGTVWVDANQVTINPDGRLLGSVDGSGVLSAVTTAGTSVGLTNGATIPATPSNVNYAIGDFLSVIGTGSITITDATGATVSQAISANSYLQIADNGSGTKFWLLNDSASSIDVGRLNNNYLAFSQNSEQGLANWSMGTVTISSNAPTGTIGAAPSTPTLTVDTTNPVSGLRSMVLTGTGTTNAGAVLYSKPFTIDRMDRNQILTLQFGFDAQTGSSLFNFTDTTSGSLKCYLYDVANNSWIPANGALNNGRLNIITGEYFTQIQTTSATQYIAAVVFMNAVVGAYRVVTDRFKFEKTQITYGTVITPWVKVNPSITADTTAPTLGTSQSKNLARQRQNGGDLEWEWDYASGASAAGDSPGSGFYRINLPVAIDTSIYGTVGVGFGGSNSIGTMSITNGTTSTTIGFIEAISATQAYAYFSPNGVAIVGSFWGSSNFQFGNAAAPISFTIKLKYPAIGYAGTAVMSSQVPTSRVHAQYYVSPSTYTVPNSSPINFDTKIEDTHNAVTTGAGWIFTAPYTMDYQVSFTVLQSSGNSNLYLQKNGIKYVYFIGYTTSSNAVGNSKSIFLKQGETLSISADNSIVIGGGFGIAGAIKASINILGIGSNQTIATDPAVYEQLEFSNTPTITTTMAVLVPSQRLRGTHYMVNLVTGAITILVSGRYRIAVHLRNSTSSNPNSCTVILSKNTGSTIVAGDSWMGESQNSGTRENEGWYFCEDAPFLAGDTYYVKAYTQNSSWVLQTPTIEQKQGLRISRIGNI